MRDSSTRRFASDSIANLIQQVWAIILSLITSILVARGLGVEERGVYAVVVLIASLIVIFLNSGMEPSFIYHIARDPEKLGIWADTVATFTIWLSALGVLMAGVVIALGHAVLFPSIAPQDLLFSLLLIPVTLIFTNLMSIFRGTQDFRSYNLVEMVTQPLALLFSFLLIWVLDWGVAGAVVAVALRYIAAIVLGFILLRRKQILITPSLRARRQQLGPLLSYAIRAYFYNIVTFLNQRLDVLLLNLFSVGVSAIGLYDIAVTLGERMWILSRSVSMVTFSRSAAFEQADAQRTHLTTLAARYVFWLGLGLAIAVFVLADWGVQLLYGVEYASSAVALRTLLPGIVTFGMGHVLSNDIAGRGKPEIIAVQSIFALVLNMVLNLFLIPRFSFAGAALASSISYPIQTGMLIWTFCRLSGATWWRLFVMTGEDVRMWSRVLQILRQRLSR